MADLKPLGSEKLQGDEKIKRILELTYYNPDKADKKSVDAEYLSESINGVYGIVKEKDGYYVKKGLTESTLDYIGGMFMKNKNRFHSYNEALKRLELLKGQELVLQEDTKYVLKVNKGNSPAASAPAPADEAVPAVPVPTDDVAGLPADTATPDVEAEPAPEDMGAETPDMGDEDDGGDYLKGIQKLTGKLGEKLRDHMDEMESDDLKYVLNSVISAIDLTKLDDSDKEEVVSQLEGDEDDLGGEDMGTEDVPEPETPGMETPEPTGDESELGEVDALEELINTPLDLTTDDSKPYDEVDEVAPPTEDDDEDLPEPEPDRNDEDSEVCTNCRGTGIVGNGKECPVCNGEGVVFTDEHNTDDDDLQSGFSTDIDDLFDDDPGYDPIEMGEESEVGEEYTGEEVFDGPDSAEVKMKEIELSELTDMIHNTVRETLGKYFE